VRVRTSAEVDGIDVEAHIPPAPADLIPERSERGERRRTVPAQDEHGAPSAFERQGTDDRVAWSEPTMDSPQERLVRRLDADRPAQRRESEGRTEHCLLMPEPCRVPVHECAERMMIRVTGLDDDVGVTRIGPDSARSFPMRDRPTCDSEGESQCVLGCIERRSSQRAIEVGEDDGSHVSADRWTVEHAPPGHHQDGRSRWKSGGMPFEDRDGRVDGACEFLSESLGTGGERRERTGTAALAPWGSGR